MNLILENTRKVNFYTSLRDIEKWMEISLADYDWHFSDIDSEWCTSEDPKWITGIDLKSEINTFDYQFVWAVISAYPKGSQPKLSSAPYADGNPNFWVGCPKKQLKDALFEIVCWDSSATLFIELPNEIGHRVLKNAPGIKDLNKRNRKIADRKVK